MVPLLVPLFISAFQRSEELADSMEARGYDPKAKRTRYHVLRFSLNDLFTFLLCGAIMSGTIVLSHFEWNLQTTSFVPCYCLILICVFIYIIFVGIIDSVRRKG